MSNVTKIAVDKYFQILTTFPPRQFQRETIAKLLNRKYILLRAPTGSGKTETVIARFLFAKILNLDFPNKLIYVTTEKLGFPKPQPNLQILLTEQY